MTAGHDRADARGEVGEDSPAAATELSDLDALSAHVGGDDAQDGDGGLAVDDDAKLDLGAIAHSSIPRAPRSFAGDDDAQGAADSGQGDPVTAPAAVARREPTFAVSVRLLQGALLGFCAGLLAGWVLFAGARHSAPTARSVPSSPPMPSSPTPVEAGQVAARAPNPPAGADSPPASSAVVDPSAAPDPTAVFEPLGAPGASAPPVASGAADSQPSRSLRGPARPAAGVTERAAVQAAAKPAVVQAAAAEPAPSPAPDAPRAMDALLEDALERRPGPAPDGPAPPSLPEAPSQADVGAAIRVLIPAISGCAAGHKGVAVVSLVVRNTGRVASARVTGAPFEATPAGRCMEGVVRKARFPRFARPTFRVQLPLKIE